MAEIEKLNGSESPLELGQRINEIIEKSASSAIFDLFDTRLTDHVLTYEESKGWALQGTYVYKEAIAGSRYGYPDFYNKVLEEKEASTATEVTLGINTITIYVHSNGHQYYDIANKDVVDNFFSAMGTAWFYGVDTENERIFLPRNNYFEQTTGDVSEVGQSIEAGLPDHAHPQYIPVDTGSGGSINPGLNDSGVANYVYTENTDFASVNNAIYGKSNTVQPNAVKKLLYICVGNIESTSSVTDIIDVTTTENDTTPLFTGMYFDFIPNNVSWLKAGEQANNAGIYSFTYNELVNVLNGETKYGDLKVVDTSDMIAGVDYSEYWVVNQDEMTFRTPIAISNKALTGAVVGNSLSLGLASYNASGELDNFGFSTSPSSNQRGLVGLNLSMYGDSLSETGQSANSSTVGLGNPIGITTDPTKSGIIAEQSTAQLYFKVANAVQNLELLNAGEVLEAVNQINANSVQKNNQADIDTVIEWGLPDYENNISFVGSNSFTAPSDGFIFCNPYEQGSANFYRYVLVNGVPVGCYSYGSNIISSLVCPVHNGDVITVHPTSASFVGTARFCPLKGVN